MKKSPPRAAPDAGARKPVARPRPARPKTSGAKPAKAETPRTSTVKTAPGAAQPAAPRKPDRRKPDLLAPRKKRGQPKSSKKIEVRLLTDDLARLDALKQRAASAGRRSKRSELMRAGLVLLQGLDPLSLCDALEALPVRRKAKAVLLPSLVDATSKKSHRPAR